MSKNDRDIEMVHVQVPVMAREMLNLIKKTQKEKRLGEIMLDILIRDFPEIAEIARKRLELKAQIEELEID